MANARTADEIVAEIRAFEPAHGEWRRLDTLLDELWATDAADQHVGELLAVLTRFPEEDGAGVLWSIVHGVESLAGYEPELVRAVRQKPSMLGVAMVGRLLNSGVAEANGVLLVELLREVAASASAPASVRQDAADWAPGMPSRPKRT